MISKCVYRKLNIECFGEVSISRITRFNAYSRKIWVVFHANTKERASLKSAVFFHGNQTLRDENITCSSGSGKL